MLKHSLSSLDQTDADRSGRIHITVIEPRQILRACLATALAGAGENFAVEAHSSATGVSAQAGAAHDVALVAGAAGRSDVLADQVRALRERCGFQHVVALCEKGDTRGMVAALEAGAQAVAPDDANLEVLSAVIRLVVAGGTYAPASALQDLDPPAAPKPTPKVADPNETVAPSLTPKQAAVVEKLRRGKPNKLIAYELNMCESTVKVHLRTVMKKMQARSRTHLATMMNRPEAVALAL